MTIAANIRTGFGSGSAGSKDQVESGKDVVIVANDFYGLLEEQPIKTTILSSRPLTPAQIELGKKIAKKHGLDRK